MSGRRFYQVNTGLLFCERATNHDWEGIRNVEFPGPFRHPLFDELQKAQYQMWRYGCGFHPEQPDHSILLDYDLKRDKPKPLRDFEDLTYYWAVSHRAYRLISAIAPDATDSRVIKVTERRNGIDTLQADYYAVDVVKFVDAIDYNNSKPDWFERGGMRFHTGAGWPYAFRNDIQENAHLFRVPLFSAPVFCDEHFKKAVEAEKLTGVGFSYVGVAGNGGMCGRPLRCKENLQETDGA